MQTQLLLAAAKAKAAQLGITKTGGLLQPKPNLEAQISSYFNQESGAGGSLTTLGDPSVRLLLVDQESQSYVELNSLSIYTQVTPAAEDGGKPTKEVFIDGNMSDEFDIISPVSIPLAAVQTCYPAFQPKYFATEANLPTLTELDATDLKAPDDPANPVDYEDREQVALGDLKLVEPANDESMWQISALPAVVLLPPGAPSPAGLKVDSDLAQADGYNPATMVFGIGMYLAHRNYDGKVLGESTKLFDYPGSQIEDKLTALLDKDHFTLASDVPIGFPITHLPTGSARRNTVIAQTRANQDHWLIDFAVAKGVTVPSPAPAPGGPGVPAPPTDIGALSTVVGTVVKEILDHQDTKPGTPGGLHSSEVKRSQASLRLFGGKSLPDGTFQPCASVDTQLAEIYKLPAKKRMESFRIFIRERTQNQDGNLSSPFRGFKLPIDMVDLPFTTAVLSNSLCTVNFNRMDQALLNSSVTIAAFLPAIQSSPEFQARKIETNLLLQAHKHFDKVSQGTKTTDIYTGGEQQSLEDIVCAISTMMFLYSELMPAFKEGDLYGQLLETLKLLCSADAKAFFTEGVLQTKEYRHIVAHNLLVKVQQVITPFASTARSASLMTLVENGDALPDGTGKHALELSTAALATLRQAIAKDCPDDWIHAATSLGLFPRLLKDAESSSTSPGDSTSSSSSKHAAPTGGGEASANKRAKKDASEKDAAYKLKQEEQKKVGFLKFTPPTPDAKRPPTMNFTLPNHPRTQKSAKLCLNFCTQGLWCVRKPEKCNFIHVTKLSDIPAEPSKKLEAYVEATPSVSLAPGHAFPTPAGASS